MLIFKPYSTMLIFKPYQGEPEVVERSESGAAFIFKNRVRHFHFRCFART